MHFSNRAFLEIQTIVLMPVCDARDVTLERMTMLGLSRMDDSCKLFINKSST